MDLQDFYHAMGADYSVVLGRLGSEARIRKYLALAASEPAFAQLREAMGQGAYGAAFQAAHTLKGICLNLELNAILAPLTELVEDLRRGGSQRAQALFAQVWAQCEVFHRNCKALE